MGLRVWAAGTGEVVSTSAQLNRMLADTTEIQKLAVMNNANLEGTMSGVNGVMKAYGIETAQVAQVSAVFNYVAATSFATVSDLAEAFKFIGPQARALGVTFEESAAALSLLSDVNHKGSIAGRAFRQMLSALVKPTAQVNEAMGDLLKPMTEVGQGWQELVFPEGRFIGLAEYFDLLAASVENLTDSQRTARLSELATLNSIPALIGLVEAQTKARKEGVNILRVYTKLLEGTVDAEVRAYQKIYEKEYGIPFSVEGAMSVFEGQWQRYIESPAGKWAQLMQRWRSAILDIGPALTDAAIPALRLLISALETVTSLLGGTDVFGAFAISAAGAVIVIGQVIAGLGSLFRVYAALKSIDAGMAAVGLAGGASAVFAKFGGAAAGSAVQGVLPGLGAAAGGATAGKLLGGGAAAAGGVVLGLVAALAALTVATVTLKAAIDRNTDERE
jgi:phage-related minor tail protein